MDRKKEAVGGWKLRHSWGKIYIGKKRQWEEGDCETDGERII